MTTQEYKEQINRLMKQYDDGEYDQADLAHIIRIMFRRLTMGHHDHNQDQTTIPNIS